MMVTSDIVRFLPGVVDRLLGIEQITLLDSRSFREKASKRRHGR